MTGSWWRAWVAVMGSMGMIGAGICFARMTWWPHGSPPWHWILPLVVNVAIVELIRQNGGTGGQ